MMRSVFLLLSLVLLAAAFEGKKYTCKRTGSATSPADSAVPWAAIGELEERYYETGWGKLVLTTNPDVSAEDQAYCAGFTEGYLTANAIAESYYNFYQDLFMTLDCECVPEGLRHYFERQLTFFRNSNDKAMKLLDTQITTMHFAAHQQNSTVPEDFLMFYMYLSAADLYELIPLYAPGQKAHNSYMEAPGMFHECSSMIKRIDGDILAGHNTWRSYVQMFPRIYKHYNLAFMHNTYHFSSMPAFPFSKDDFYTMDNGMIVMETTNGVYDESKLQLISSESLLFWQRVFKANGQAKTAQEWTEIFAVDNSGTYNNQWMVLNGNITNMALKEDLPDGSFWILEQAPSRCWSHDVTEVLNRQGYWGSYNIPFDKEAYDFLGYEERYHSNPRHFSYDHCPRAELFRLHQSSVESIDDLKHLLRYNGYPNDPITGDSTYDAVASRGDLDQTKKRAFGTIDAKVTSVNHAKQGVSYAVAGPTHQELPPFSWLQDEDMRKYKHHGHPDTFKFDWVEVEHSF